MWRSAPRMRQGSAFGAERRRIASVLSGATLRYPGCLNISSQALLRHPNRCVTPIARSTGHQGDDSNSPAGPLVPTPQQQNGNLPAVPSSSGGLPKVPVQFVVPEYLTHWGQVLKVVGSLEELGSWKVEQAPSMQWNEGHTWTLDIQLPVGAVNFKIVMHDQPNSSVRWEQGEDRSVLIPETTTVTGAPVGQVGVTCNFNDVHNSRVEVRPDRAYLKQQLKAVEARVLAIQEKKRKLDQRMSVLTDGLKKYDATVAMLQDGVKGAVDSRRTTKEPAQQQQKQQLQQPAQQQQPAEVQQPASSNGVPVSPMGRGGSIQVPILDPSQLPGFDDVPAAAAAGSSNGSSSVSSVDEAAAAAVAEAAFADAAALLSADSSSSTAAAAYVPDVAAIKANHVNETVLSATVDQLLAAAEDALARSGSGAPSEAVSSLSAGTAGVDDVQLAEEYVEELLAAASALEQQADRRANMLLEAAKQSGDSTMAADIEQLASAELPPIPSAEELAEAAAAAAVTPSDTGSLEEEPAAAEAPQQQQQQQQVVVLQVQPPQQQQQQQEGAADSGTAARPLDRDGSITFTAETLNVDVDVKKMLTAVLSRVGIPLNAQVTISATYTPNTSQDGEPLGAAGTAAAAAAAASHLESAAEASLDANIDSMAAGSSNHTAQQQQQPQQQQRKKKRRSPIEAIAAVFTRSNSEDDEDDNSSNGSSSSSNGASNGASNSSSSGQSCSGNYSRSEGGNYSLSSSSSNGTSATPYSSGRYSKTAAAAPEGLPARTAGRSLGSPAAAAAAGTAAASAPAAAGTATAAAAAGPAVQAAVRFDPQEAARQLESKEAARRAAAERVAAALAQVEEMRRSVVAANSLLRQQLRGTDSSLDGGSSSSGSNVQGGVGPQAEPVSAPGAPRGLPAIAATAVTPSVESPEASSSSSGAASGKQQQEAEVQGEVREELSLLAALAAEVQKNSRRPRP